MKTISIINNKGGVGKTTTALNLGKELSNMGNKVLLIDMDPQKANLTALLTIEPKATIYDVLLGEKQTKQVIHQTKYQDLDIIPADKKLEELYDIYSEYKGSPGNWGVLRSALSAISDSYNYIIIDNAPAITIGTYFSLTASDQVIVPLNVDAYGFYGLNGITEIIQEVKTKSNPALYFAGCILTRFINDELGKDIAGQLQEIDQYPTFKTCVRESPKMRQSTFDGQAIGESSFRSAAAVDYRRLAKEYLEMCSL